MGVVNLKQVTKRFGDTLAVDELSFDIQPGEIFGLLGPNGAGKTTAIRMILDIFKPDRGEISVLGGPMNENKMDRIGYLPEERGLYQDIPLERCLTFLASLKGMEQHAISESLPDYLQQFDLYQHRDKKVKELSKGMQQKAQLIATLIHNPELVIVDEPFSALDPVNTEMVKEILVQKREEGKAIIMSTHQMNQVEELCDRILLINYGRRVLYGTLPEIQSQFSSRDVLIRPLSPLPDQIKGVVEIQQVNKHTRLVLEEDFQPAQVLKNILDKGIDLASFEIAIPPLNQIFITVVKSKEEQKNA